MKLKGCSDHGMVVSKMFRAMRREHSKFTTMDFRIADLVFPGSALLWDKALERGTGKLINRDYLFQAMHPKKKEIRQTHRRPAWMNKVFLETQILPQRVEVKTGILGEIRRTNLSTQGSAREDKALVMLNLVRDKRAKIKSSIGTSLGKM